MLVKEIEKEYRYLINDEIINKIRTICKTIEANQEQIDLTLGYYGFNSLKKLGYVTRVRKKADKIWMEIKRRREDGSFIETKLDINDFNNGVKIFSEIGMLPYMYMKRNREILDFKGLRIFLDDIDILGKYVEIEYQQVENSKEKIKDFLNTTGIIDDPQPLYGDIINLKLKTDNKFKDKYSKKMRSFISQLK